MPFVGRLIGHVDAIDFDRARRRGFEAGQHAQQCRLATARTTENREQLSLLDCQVDIVDGSEITEVFANASNANEILHIPLLILA